MARGRRRKDEEENIPVIKTDIEDGVLPNILVGENFGILVDTSPRQYSCLSRRPSTRLIEKDGKKYLEQYYKWSAYAHYGRMDQALSRIIDQMISENLSTKERISLKEAVEIIQETYSFAEKELSKIYEHESIDTLAQVLEEKSQITNEVQRLKNVKKELEKEVNSFMDFIREKRQIIISNTEEKKHRLKLEK